MALNWAMIDADQRPVPLPEEKIWLAVEKCQMSLEFQDPHAKWDAKGTVHVTNQRVVFLRHPPLPPPAEHTAPSEHLRSLNVPLTHLVDSRYLIPIFGAPYYEAGVLPVPGGNLPEARPGGPTVKGLLKIWFNEGGGAAFRDAVEEVRNLARGGKHGEQLPLYQPPTAPGTPGAPSVAATANSSLESRTIGGDYSERSSVAGPSYFSGRPSSRSSQLSAQDLDAARVAHQEEEAEREAIRQRAESNAAAPGIEATAALAATQSLQQNNSNMEEDEPPAYAMVSPVTTYVRAQEGEGRGRCRGDRSRAFELRFAMRRVLGSDEGRDRILQLCVGLALLAHYSFGSVRHPRSFGIFPIPHVLFLLFSRPARREALTGIRNTGEAAENSRKLLLLLKWFRDLAWRAGQILKGREWQKDGERSEHADVRVLRKNEEVKMGKENTGETRSGNNDTHRQSTVKMVHEELRPWQEDLNHFGDLLSWCGTVADITAFLGGSVTVWRVLSGRWSSSGKRTLRYQQRAVLERIALSFAIVSLAIQVYILSAIRRRARRTLGQLHRQILLLTDDLADAQRQEGGSRHRAPYASLPGLHSHFDDEHELPRKTSKVASSSRRSSSISSSSTSSSATATPACSLTTSGGGGGGSRSRWSMMHRSTSQLSSIRQCLISTEERFRSVRRFRSQRGWEMTTCCCELGSALVEAMPLSNRVGNRSEGWQAYLSILAGVTGLVKVAREEEMDGGY